LLKKATISKIWQKPPRDLASRLEGCLAEVGRRRFEENFATVFFRADDIGVPGDRFGRLIEIFRQHGVPLSLAVVPAWLTSERWAALMKRCRNSPSLWCWHQHGWRHKNHERRWKKQEFGPSRSPAEIELDLVRGRDRLVSIMGSDFYPLFTPPWNRCSEKTLELLARLGYRAVSRSWDAKPVSERGLPDVPVNVDLHTRKETRSEDGWQNLLQELETALSNSCCGIMIHHQRMNAAAFEFMEMLLRQLTRADGCRLTGMPEIVEDRMGRKP
jgi:hypothetical protein